MKGECPRRLDDGIVKWAGKKIPEVQRISSFHRDRFCVPYKISSVSKKQAMNFPTVSPPNLVILLLGWIFGNLVFSLMSPATVWAGDLPPQIVDHEGEKAVYPASNAVVQSEPLLHPSARPLLVNSPTCAASDFSDGTLMPFSERTTKKPNYVKAATLDGRSCAEVFWSQAGYDGTRVTKGAEAEGKLRFSKEGWFSFKFYLPSKEYPYDKTAGMAQIFSLGGGCSWAGLMNIENNSLVFNHRHASIAPERAVICQDIKRDQWNQVRIHFIASHQKQGMVQVWYGDSGVPVYERKKINFAFGEWIGDRLSEVDQKSRAGTAFIQLKFGQYNHDPEHYTVGETRKSYYTDVMMSMTPPDWYTVGISK